MKIVGEKIYLTPISEKDTVNIVKWRNSDSVRKNFIYQELFTYESQNTWIKDEVYTKKVVQFIIKERDNGTSVGTVFLRDIDLKNHNKAEYGIFIGNQDARGKGYGSEAAQLICQYGFEILKLNKIFLRVLADNIPAIRSYEKVGFTHEGYLKKDVKINNQYKDLLLMAKLNIK